MQDAGFRKKQPHSQAPPQLAVALMQPKIWGDIVTKNLGRHQKPGETSKIWGDNMKSWGEAWE